MARAMTKEDVLQIRSGLGLSVRQFALIVGAAPSLVTHWETGRREISVDSANCIRQFVREYAEQRIVTLQDLIKLYT